MERERKQQVTEEEITPLGHPEKPTGEAGAQMLLRMNESHFAVTGWALDFWTIHGDDKILDIGCGGGATLKRMADAVTGGHLTGVDYSPVSVEESKKTNALQIAEGKTDVTEASVESLPFADESFDKIITVESFYFWPNPQENLKEVFRVLKKGGTFLLVADIYDTPNLSQKALENIERYHMFNPSIKKLTEMFARANFSDTEIHTKEDTTWICAKGGKKI